MEDRKELEEKLRIALLKANYDCYAFAMTACNVSGIVHDLSSVITNVLWPVANFYGYGTEWVNTHPIVICYADKIADLSGMKGENEVFNAYHSVRQAYETYMETVRPNE